MCLSLFSGCTSKTTGNNLERDTLYQVSTLNSLLVGNYDGLQTVSELKANGDIGIGTFDALDGELVMIDRKVYKVKDTGKVEEMEDSVKIPFAAVTFFDEDSSKELVDINDFDSLKKELDSLIENKDLFYAIKVDATFNYVKTRSVPKQEKPYPVLSEVTKNQPTFEYTEVKGSLVGFWCPEYVGGINVPGYHLHFISDDRTKGGHLLEVDFDKANVYMDITEGFTMQLSQESVFGNIADMEEEIRNVEQNEDTSDYVPVTVFVEKDEVMGENGWNGAWMAAEEWNNTPNREMKIKLEKVVYGTEPEDQKIQYDKMIEENKPVAVLGSMYGHVTVNIKENISKAGIPYLTGASTVQVTENNDGNIFRIRTDDKVVINNITKYLANTLGKKKIALLYTDGPYGMGAKDILLESAKKYEVAITKLLPYGDSSKDLSTQIKELKESDAEFLLVWALPTEVPEIIEEMEKDNLKIPFIGSISFYPTEQGVSLPSFVNGNYVAIDYIPKDTDKEWSDKVETRFGNYVVYPIFATYYDAVKMLCTAIEKVDTDSEDIKKELKNQPYQGIVGKYEFDDGGDSLNQIYITQIKDGKLQFSKIIESNN